MSFIIENQYINLNDKYKGKYIHEMTAVELLAMEAEMREKANIKHFKYVGGGSGKEIAIENPTPTYSPRQQSSATIESGTKKRHLCSININGHHYDSFEEMMEGEKNAPNVIQNITTLADGTKIVQKNGKTYINGEEQNTGKNPVYVLVCGNVKEINTQLADVTVYGDVDDVKTASGDIKATTIKCSAKTLSGDVRAEVIYGSASTMSGDIIKRE